MVTIMEATVTASDFRHKFPDIVKQVSDGKTLIAILRSKPVFRVVPLNADAAPANWLGKLRDASSYSEPSMEEINKIVHKLRKEKI